MSFEYFVEVKTTELFRFLWRRPDEQNSLGSEVDSGMGCASSKQNVDAKSSGPDEVNDDLKQNSGQPRYARLSVDGAFSQFDRAPSLKKTRLSEEKTLELPQSKLKLRYAYMTRTGYYPHDKNKPNQDALFVHEQLGVPPADEDPPVFMGVLDGHGETGTGCSEFVRDMIPALISKSPRFHTNPGSALCEASAAANIALHCSEIDDSLSGTTLCAVLLQGRTATIANVGDSRAVAGVARTDEDSVIAVELSEDQTPFREDERRRVIQAGARVMTLEQMEGTKDPTIQAWTTEAECDGDPPRLWAQNGLYPGTAFTRSVGDSIAEQLGVIPDPEISKFTIDSSFKFVIIATDGLWEFVTSQEAVIMVENVGLDPTDAVNALGEAAHQRWMKTEGRTDDITIICIFFEDL